VSCDPASEEAVLQLFRSEGFATAARVGRVEAGPPGLRVAA
jgi:selenide,water dikinase